MESSSLKLPSAFLGPSSKNEKKKKKKQKKTVLKSSLYFGEMELSSPKNLIKTPLGIRLYWLLKHSVF